jgi:hypothetical protein
MRIPGIVHPGRQEESTGDEEIRECRCAAG